MRDPSFVNLQALKKMGEGSLIADFIASLAMLDPILGGVDQLSGRPRADSPSAGTRPTTWTRTPGLIPDPADVEVPDGAAREPSRRTWRATRTSTRPRCRRWPRRRRCTAGARRWRCARPPRSCRSPRPTCRRWPPSTTCCAPSPAADRYLYVCTSVACHLRTPSPCTTPSPRRRATRTWRAWRCASSSAWAPATWRRWPRSTAASSDRSTRATRTSWWRAVKERARGAAGQRPALERADALERRCVRAA